MTYKIVIKSWWTYLHSAHSHIEMKHRHLHFIFKLQGHFCLSLSFLYIFITPSGFTRSANDSRHLDSSRREVPDHVSAHVKRHDNNNKHVMLTKKSIPLFAIHKKSQKVVDILWRWRSSMSWMSGVIWICMPKVPLIKVLCIHSCVDTGPR